MQLKIIAAARTDGMQAIIDRLDAGSGPATIDFYTAAQPAGPHVAVTTQTLLGTATCSKPCATVSNGVATFAAVTQEDAALDDGTAVWVRFRDSDGNAVIDGDVTDTAGNGVVKLNTTTVVQGGPIAVSSAVLTMGGA